MVQIPLPLTVTMMLGGSSQSHLALTRDAPAKARITSRRVDGIE